MLKRFLIMACLFLFVVTGCQTDDSQPAASSSKEEVSKEKKSSAKKEASVENYKFKFDQASIEALKKGKIKGFPVQLGDDEKKVRKILGEPKKRKDDGHGEITWTYPNYELYFTYYQGVGPDLKELDVSVLKSITFPIQMDKSEVESVMGKPSDEQAIRPGYPQLMYDFHPYELVFLTSEERPFEGPYDQLNLMDVGS